MAVPADTVAFVIGLGSECGCLCRHAIAVTDRCFRGLAAAADCALSITMSWYNMGAAGQLYLSTAIRVSPAYYTEG